MPVSISSKTTVSISSACAKIDFIASITREISPPDATFANGFKSSEIFVEIKNSILSIPLIFNSQGSNPISKRTLGNSNFSSFSTIKDDRTCA